VQFEFVAGRPCLDFIATVADRGAADVERLTSRTDLADWLVLAGLLDAPPRVTLHQFERAKALREAMYRIASTLIGPPDRLPAADVALVNRAARTVGPAVRLSVNGEVRRSGTLEQALSALARDLIDLMDGPDRALVRLCADAHCTRAFIDRSRGGRRRWCGMAGCGDRAKAAAYRRRRREG
jgi:predicted RNA-binding Zn ribbon-like protein